MVMVLENKREGTLKWDKNNPLLNYHSEDVLEALGRALAVMHRQKTVEGVEVCATGLTFDRWKRQKDIALEYFILPNCLIKAFKELEKLFIKLEEEVSSQNKMLCHLCIHPGNVLLDRRFPFLIDFTEAGLDAPCIDFMNIIDFFV